MSIPSRPVSGFVPLSDVAGAVELPGGRALTPAAPQARHHFTTFHQVNQLIEASEADADMGFMARLLALCSLPRNRPKNPASVRARQRSIHALHDCRRRKQTTLR